jgi:dTDP-4-amino-4,6-dideoxygalactose transaminase
MTDLQDAVGREQLRRLPEILERRRSLADSYRCLLSVLPDVDPVCEPSWARSNFQGYWVTLPAWAEQRGVMQCLLDRGIPTRRGICNAHEEPAYRNHPGTFRAAGSLRHSEALRNRALVLPLFHDMTLEDQEFVVGSLAAALSEVPQAVEVQP